MNEFGFTPETQNVLNRLNRGFFRLIGIPFKEVEAESIVVQPSYSNPTDEAKEQAQVEKMDSVSSYPSRID